MGGGDDADMGLGGGGGDGYFGGCGREGAEVERGRGDGECVSGMRELCMSFCPLVSCFLGFALFF